jgi:hypothetical protein
VGRYVLPEHPSNTPQSTLLNYKISLAFREWKIWAAVVMFWGNTIGVYGYAISVQSHYINSDKFFRFTATVPTVIQQLGYSSANAQLLTIPIYVFAMTIVLIFSFWSDRIQSRSPFIIAGFSIAIVGFIAQLAIPHPKYPGLTYGFLFPVAAGLYAPFVSIVCWIGLFFFSCLL